MQAGTAARTLVTYLRRHAEHQPEAQAFTFLEQGERPGRSLTFAALDQEARSLGAWLQNQGAEGERVLLLFEPGLDFVTAFLGCLYAGAVAVPAYPPDPRRLERTLPRLQAVAASADPKVALTSSGLLMMLPMLSEVAPDLGSLHWAASDEHSTGTGEGWVAPEVAPEDLALLQFTSGS